MRLQATWSGRSCRRALIVTDAHVADLSIHHGYEAAFKGLGIESTTTVLPAGEASKSLACASRLYDELVACKADRHTTIVALGGGVIGDLAGFVAATYARGLPLLMVPTTLLAQVDSSVGGKVGDQPSTSQEHDRGIPPTRWRLDRHRDAQAPARSGASLRVGRGRQVRRHPGWTRSSPELEDQADKILERQRRSLAPDCGAELPAQGGRRLPRRARRDRSPRRAELRPHDRPCDRVSRRLWRSLSAR